MYYLHHYFDPDFHEMLSAPSQETATPFTSHFPSFVQNVVRGQVLAELTDLKNIPENLRDPRFIFPEHRLPIGPHCAPHNENPDKIIATENGYVAYRNGLITVRKVLNIHKNIGLETGNVFFVGDIAMNADVQTGFSLHGNNILVNGHIERAWIHGNGDVVCKHGIRGYQTTPVDNEYENTLDDITPPHITLIEACGNLRLPFCSNAQLRARGNMVIDGSCLHSSIYVGGHLIIKGRLLGGEVYAGGLVYVEGALGNDYGQKTRVTIGYDPFASLQLRKMKERIRYLRERRTFYENISLKYIDDQNDFIKHHELVNFELRSLLHMSTILQARLEATVDKSAKCRLVAHDFVMPDCEISIGSAELLTDSVNSHLTFYYRDNEVRIRSNNKDQAQNNAEDPEPLQ